MPKTIKAKFLLGWMCQHEAVDALNSCIFDPPLSKKKAIALWKEYRDRVAALEPREIATPTPVALGAQEKAAIAAHIQQVKAGPNSKYLKDVIKACPEQLVAHQFYVITERSEEYAGQMRDPENRTKQCLGVGLGFNGQLVPRAIGTKRFDVDLPHTEFLIVPSATGFDFKERDRYLAVVEIPNRKGLLLWGGYHRTHALLTLRQAGGEAAGAAPLLTVMAGIPEVEQFFSGSKRVAVRDCVLGPRPALLSDFLNPDLFISVDLRKKRAVGRIEQIRPGKFRAGVFQIDDES